MKLLLIISTLLAAQIAALAAPVDEIDCSKIDEVIDEYGPAQGYSSLSAKYPLTKTREEHEFRCNGMNDAIKLLRKYNSKCNTGLTQQVFSAILRSRKAFNDMYCQLNTTEGQQLYDGLQCVRENSLNKLQEAEKRFVVYGQVLLEANIADEKVRTRRVCCTVLDGTQGLLDAFSDKCSKYDKVFGEYVESYKSEAMGLICPAVEKLECDKLEKLKYEGVEPKPWFFLNPVLKVVKTMDH